MNEYLKGIVSRDLHICFWYFDRDRGDSSPVVADKSSGGLLHLAIRPSVSSTVYKDPVSGIVLNALHFAFHNDLPGDDLVP
jgi:hypothetical protein